VGSFGQADELWRDRREVLVGKVFFDDGGKFLGRGLFLAEMSGSFGQVVIFFNGGWERDRLVINGIRWT
jgi:hypothetical protein